MIRTATVVVAAVAGSAHADLIEMRFLGTDEGRNVRVTHDSGFNANVFAGGLQHEINVTGSNDFLSGRHTTFCVDLFEPVESDWASYGLHGTDIDAPMRGLISGVISRSDEMRGDVSERDRQAATQLVLWELLYDYNEAGGSDSINFSSGSLTVTRTNGQALWNSVLNAADAIVDSMASGSGFGLWIADRDGVQDQAFVAVPAPTTFGLAMLGGSMFGLRRRRG